MILHMLVKSLKGDLTPYEVSSMDLCITNYILYKGTKELSKYKLVNDLWLHSTWHLVWNMSKLYIWYSNIAYFCDRKKRCKCHIRTNQISLTGKTYTKNHPRLAPSVPLFFATLTVIGCNGAFLCWKIAATGNFSALQCTTFLPQQGISVRKHCASQHFFAQSCTSGTRSARAVNFTVAPRYPEAHFPPPSVFELAQRTALTLRVCMKYSACALYTVRALTSALCTHNIHCQCTHRCPVNAQCTL